MYLLKRIISGFIAIGILVSCLFCCQLLAAPNSISDALPAPSLFSLSLKSLRQPELIALERFQNKKIILSFFEPDCAWCFRQIIALDQLHLHCADTTHIILIGINGTRQALQNELRRTKTQLPAFAVNQNLLSITGPITATPQTFIFNAQGIVIDRVPGYTPFSPAWISACSTSTPH